MLQSIRDRAHGWFAWVIVFLISVPFALWGIQSYLDVGGEPVVAKVNGVEISQRDLDQRVQQARIQLRERLGAGLDANQLDDATLRREMLNDMIREALTVDVSRHLGMGVADDELRVQILAEPAFQRDGRFDAATYEQVLGFQGLSPGEFEAQIRQRMIGSQLVRAVVASEFLTQAERESYARLSGQRRELSWAQIPVSRFVSDDVIPDAEITAYYETNGERFRVPEQVKLDYLLLDVASLTAKGQVTEEQVRQAYDANQARFGQPERRRVRHLLRTIPPDADEGKTQAVLAEVQGLRARIQGGEAFEGVAKAMSQDPGSASQGGDLGEIEPGIMDPVFDQAAFSLAANTLSEPVKSRFGYHLIEVQTIIPAQVKPFEQVRAELEQELSRQAAEALFYDLGERLASAVYEAPDSLEPAAEELGLTIQHSDWIDRQGGEGLLGHAKVRSAAFSEDVLTERRNSELIEPEKESLQAVVVRVVDHREASSRPLAEVREEIVVALRQERARKATAAAAEDLLTKLRGGADWATTLAPDAPEAPKLVTRNQPGLPGPVRTLAFTLPAPAEGQASLGSTTLDTGDVALVRVTRIEPGEAGKPGGPESTMLAQLMGRQAYDALISDMERRAKIERRALATPSDG